MQSLKTRAAVVQFCFVTLLLQQAFLTCGLLAAAKFQTVRQCVFVGFLERQNCCAAFGQFFVKPRHLLFEKLQGLPGRAGAHFNVFS